MNLFTLIREYVVWHYSRAFTDMFGIWKNFLWYINHLFSVPDVIMTLFAPWKRLQEKKVNILKDPQEFFMNLVVNLIMRLIGLLVRTVILVIALTCFAVIIVLGFVVAVTWLFLPLLLVEMLITGLTFFFA